MKPDLVVISGDVTDDGWDSIDELKWAKDWLSERIDRKWFAIPGNHDVGNFIDATDGAIHADRVNNWGSVFNEFEFYELDGWCIFGFNSMQLGMGDDCEDRLLSEIRFQLTETSSWKAHVALFIHSPFFVESIDEKDAAIAYWTGPATPRAEMWGYVNQQNVKLIGSGHVHQARLTEADGINLAWAPPASGTWVHSPGLPNPPMPEQTGFFLHTLRDDGRVESELIECAPMLKLYEHNPWP